MIKPEDCTIIIPHLGTTDEQYFSLQECRISLQETVPDIKRIVVVNGNLNPIQFNEYENETWIHIKEQGQCRAVNAAVATTNTPWIFITNDDMIFPKLWFEKLTDTIEQSKLTCISPKLIEPRWGAPTFEVQFFGGAGGDFNKQHWDEFVENYYRSDAGYPIGIRTGFNFPVLIRRDLWDTIGGYDINYEPWGSNGDSDLEYKIKLAGVQPYQNTNCIVYHFSQTSGTFEPKNDEYRFKNYAYFKEKWGFDRTDDGIWEATFEIPNEGRIYRPEWENKYK